MAEITAERVGQDTPAETRLPLDAARGEYGEAFRRNDRCGIGYFSDTGIKDESFKHARQRYERARRDHLVALANAYGPDRAIDFEKAEKKKLGWLKLKSWERAAFYAGGAAAATGVTWGIGPLTLISSVGISLGINFSMKKWNIAGWNNDSAQLASAREVLQQKWVKAQSEGLPYEQFLKRERKAVREYSRWIGKDKRFRLYIRATISGVALGATGLRPGLLSLAADGLNDSFGDGVGEKIVYGDQWVQKFVRYIAVPLIESIMHPIGAAQAAAYDPHTLGTEAQKIADIHWPEQHMTLADLFQLEQQLPLVIAWAEHVADEYARTMDMHDDRCIKELTHIRLAIQHLKLIQHDLAQDSKSILRKIALLNSRGPQGEHMPNLIKALLAKDAAGHALLGIGDDLDVVRNGSDLVAQLGGGKVFVTGSVQEIKTFFKALGIEFAVSDQWKMTPRTSRMLMELYRDIRENPRLRHGLIITEGDDGDGIKAGHSSTGGHPTGDAFDMLPKGAITRDYIYSMYAMMYENMLIAHRDPRIIPYFEAKIAEYTANGDAEMKAYYERRLLWAENPFARQYYEFIYEPGKSGPSGIKDEVMAHLMKEYGISSEEVRRFMTLKYGNQTLTTGEHFHIWPPAELREWRSDTSSYLGPEKRD